MSEVYRTPFTPPEGFPSLELPDDVPVVEADAPELPSLVPLAAEAAKDIVNEPLPDLTAPPSLEVASSSVDVELPSLELPDLKPAAESAVGLSAEIATEMSPEVATELGEEALEAAGVNEPKPNGVFGDLLGQIRASTERFLQGGSGDAKFQANELIKIIDNALADPNVASDFGKSVALHSARADIGFAASGRNSETTGDASAKITKLATELHDYLNN